MTDQQGEDGAFAADMLLIDELVDELGLDRWPGDSETILEVGNLEDTRILAIAAWALHLRDHQSRSPLDSRCVQLRPRRSPLLDHGPWRVHAF